MGSSRTFTLAGTPREVLSTLLDECVWEPPPGFEHGGIVIDRDERPALLVACQHALMAFAKVETYDRYADRVSAGWHNLFGRMRERGLADSDGSIGEIPDPELLRIVADVIDIADIAIEALVGPGPWTGDGLQEQLRDLADDLQGPYDFGPLTVGDLKAALDTLFNDDAGFNGTEALDGGWTDKDGLARSLHAALYPPKPCVPVDCPPVEELHVHVAMEPALSGYTFIRSEEGALDLGVVTPDDVDNLNRMKEHIYAPEGFGDRVASALRRNGVWTLPEDNAYRVFAEVDVLPGEDPDMVKRHAAEWLNSVLDRLGSPMVAGDGISLEPAISYPELPGDVVFDWNNMIAMTVPEGTPERGLGIALAQVHDQLRVISELLRIQITEARR